MTEHPTKQELADYRERVLAPAVFLSVHRHVTACAHCAEQCKSNEDLARDLDDLNSALLYAPDETPYHLSAAEVAAYVGGTSDEIDLEIAESHLSTCLTCASEVQRQKTFVPQRLSMKWWRPLPVAVVVAFGIIAIMLAMWLIRSRPGPQKEWNTANTSSPQNSPPPAEVQPSVTPEILPEAEVALVLNDGPRKVTVDKQGRLAGLEQLPSSVQQRIRAALQAGRLQQPSALAQVASRPSALLSESGNGLPFPLIGPLGQVVLSERPTFRWRPLPGAQSYTVIVTDADLNEIATSPPLNTTKWRIAKPLKDGGIYSWQVTALKDGVKITSPVLPAPQARFKVIDHATSELIQTAQRAYPDSHLTLGVLYAEAGLLDEAEQELRILVRNNPRAPVALKLLQNIKTMRATQKSSSGRN
jgi:hypothetical protein